MFSESFHPVQNGVTTSVRTLIAELRKYGHHVWVFAPEHQDQPEHETNVMRFPSFVTQFNPEYPLAYPFLPRIKLSSQIERLKLDVIHTHSPFVLGLTGADLAIRKGIPLVSTYHTLYTEYSHYVSFIPEAVTHGLLEAYLPWYYNRCSTVICPSALAMEHLKASGIERPIAVIPTGIPIPFCEDVDDRACAGIRARLNVGRDTPLMLYAGRLAPEKQIPWLLTALARIAERIPEVVLAIAGGGPMLEELTELAKSMGIADRTKFLGPVPRCEMDPIYAAADLFVFPSPSETQGLVIGEARAAGTPAVVIDAGGAPETVKHGIDGFRIAEGDLEGFTNCVEHLLRDRDYLARISANALKAAEEHTPDQMTLRILDVYMNSRIMGRTAGMAAAIPARAEAVADPQTVRQNIGK
jgi:glycosyltransferase involved in cell wall biosynthesis